MVAASLRLIPVFSEGKWSIHEKHAEYILILSAASLSFSHYEKLTTARLLQKTGGGGGLFFSTSPAVHSAQTRLNCLLLFPTPILTFEPSC